MNPIVPRDVLQVTVGANGDEPDRRKLWLFRTATASRYPDEVFLVHVTPVVHLVASDAVLVCV